MRRKEQAMENQQSPPLLEFWLPADLQAVPSARHRAMRVCTDAGLTDDDCFALDLALGEALANAVMHGAKNNTEAEKQQVYLGLWHHRQRLIIQVRDFGVGFHPPTPPYPMPDATNHESHGRGLPLMEMLTDAMAICSGCIREGGSSVFLIKRVPH
jgi:anti-sigma regulatory factor (Ser/Thr protein kinase)